MGKRFQTLSVLGQRVFGLPGKPGDRKVGGRWGGASLRTEDLQSHSGGFGSGEDGEGGPNLGGEPLNCSTLNPWMSIFADGSRVS